MPVSYNSIKLNVFLISCIFWLPISNNGSTSSQKQRESQVFCYQERCILGVGLSRFFRIPWALLHATLRMRGKGIHGVPQVYRFHGISSDDTVYCRRVITALCGPSPSGVTLDRLQPMQRTQTWGRNLWVKYGKESQIRPFDSGIPSLGTR